MAKMSIIIPTYNRSNIVKEAVESVLAQTFADFEVIIVDDGSADNTCSLIQTIKDDRIRYFYKDNGGACSARNFGLTKAKGQYIAFLDSDDLWPEDYIETMLRYLDAHKEYGAAYSRVMLMLPDGKTKQFGKQDRFRSGVITKDFFGGGLCVLPSAASFRMAVWKDFWWDEALTNSFDDFDVFLRLSIKTKFLFVPNICALRRENSGSVSNLAGRTISPYGPLIMERFYFRLGGYQYIPKSTAKQKISHRYRSLAKLHRAAGNRHAAILLFKRAIRYYPLDIRLYIDLLRALLKSKKADVMPGWQMPKLLPPVKCSFENVSD